MHAVLWGCAQLSKERSGWQDTMISRHSRVHCDYKIPSLSKAARRPPRSWCACVSTKHPIVLSDHALFLQNAHDNEMREALLPFSRRD